MAANDVVDKVLEYGENIEVGDKVTVFWTASSRRYSGVGTVEKVNKSSVAVSLDQDVDCYKQGRKIKAPRPVFGVNWSWSNVVLPLDF